MKKQHGFLRIVETLPGGAARDTRYVLRCHRLLADGKTCGARRTLRKHVLLTGQHDRCAACAAAARRAPRRQATLAALPAGLRGAAVARLRAYVRGLREAGLPVTLNDLARILAEIVECPELLDDYQLSREQLREQMTRRNYAPLYSAQESL